MGPDFAVAPVDVDSLAAVTGRPVAMPGDPMTGLGTPVDIALTGTGAIAIVAGCRATGAAVVLAVSFGVSSPLYMPAAICACVWA